MSNSCWKKALPSTSLSRLFLSQLMSSADGEITPIENACDDVCNLVQFLCSYKVCCRAGYHDAAGVTHAPHASLRGERGDGIGGERGGGVETHAAQVPVAGVGYPEGRRILQRRRVQYARLHLQRRQDMGVALQGAELAHNVPRASRS